jgi:catechol 2,3-dioxygenase-like lactoylglutathione lyase family enzyme
MDLISSRIITADIQRLTDFYAKITGRQITFYTPDFAELKTGVATLAIGSTKTLQAFGGDSVAKAAANQTLIIEFKVADVDEIYGQLEQYLSPYLVQKPTLMPWGNRSLLFRDPDGNLVNFFTPVSQDARAKFSKQA